MEPKILVSVFSVWFSVFLFGIWFSIFRAQGELLVQRQRRSGCPHRRGVEKRVRTCLFVRMSPVRSKPLASLCKGRPNRCKTSCLVLLANWTSWCGIVFVWLGWVFILLPDYQNEAAGGRMEPGSRETRARAVSPGPGSRLL